MAYSSYCIVEGLNIRLDGLKTHRCMNVWLLMGLTSGVKRVYYEATGNDSTVKSLNNDQWLLCVCQLSSRFTTQCHASTCHVVCGYIYICIGMERIHCKVGVDFAHLRTWRFQGLQGDGTAFHICAATQSRAAGGRFKWRTGHDTAKIEMHCMTWRFRFLDPNLGFHILHLCSCQESNPRISMNFSTLFLLLKTLSEFSKHWLPMTASPVAAQALSLLGAATQRGNSAFAKQRTDGNCKWLAHHCNKMEIHISALPVHPWCFSTILQPGLSCADFTRSVKECQRQDTRKKNTVGGWDQNLRSQGMEWYGSMDTYHNALKNTYHFLPLWQPFCLSDSFWPARALDLMLAASAALRRQNVRPQKIASRKCKRKKGRM